LFAFHARTQTGKSGSFICLVTCATLTSNNYTQHFDELEGAGRTDTRAT